MPPVIAGLFYRDDTIRSVMGAGSDFPAGSHALGLSRAMEFAKREHGRVLAFGRPKI
jgi:putative effector of murein hydrolase